MFLGEVPSNQLITGNTLASHFNLTQGVSQNSNEPWLKFILDGKTLYVSKKPFRHSISWNHLNDLDLVFGNRTIDIDGKEYRIRLLKGVSSDPISVPSLDNEHGGYDLEWTYGSEWNRIFYPLIPNPSRQDHLPSYPYSNEGILFGQWGNYTETELGINDSAGYGYRTWTQESRLENLNTKSGRGHYGVLRAGFVDAGNSLIHRGWRPVLELVEERPIGRFSDENLLKETPWQALIDMINAKFLLRLDSKTTILKELIPGTGVDTTIKIDAFRNSTLPELTQDTFTYQRLRLEDFFPSALQINTIVAPTNSWIVANTIFKGLGIVIDRNDFIYEEIETLADLSHYVLKANPYSLRWVGEVVINGGWDLIDLSTHLTYLNLTETLQYPTDVEDTIFGIFNTTPFNFTRFNNELRGVKEWSSGTTSLRLAAILTDITQKHWICEGTLNPYNICSELNQGDASHVCVYNGPVNGYRTARRDIRNVLVLQLNEQFCSNISGQILLHYN